MVIFYKKCKKYDEIRLTKNKMDLNIRKMTHHPPSPVVELNLHLPGSVELTNYIIIIGMEITRCVKYVQSRH